MESPEPDLSEWVAIKKNIFTIDDDVNKIKFICGWNSEKQNIAIIYHEGQRQASDMVERNKASLISVSDFSNINKQLCLLDSTIDKYYPIRPKRQIVSSLSNTQSKNHEYILKSIEHYLYRAVEIFGKKVIVSLMFDNDEDSFAEFEENISELKSKSLESAVARGYKELDEVLELRKKSETLLEMKSLYVLEDEASKHISIALSEMYTFQLQPFIEIRELSQTKLSYARDRLKEEIGPNIKKQMHQELEEWNDQYLISSEAIEQLYQEYYRKTVNLIQGERDRMVEDQKRFGKAAFSLFALPRLQSLEVQVYQEKLKLLNAVKATKEFQRDKIKQQLGHVSSNSNAISEIENIQQDIYDAQLGVLESHFEVLEVEERLYKTQLAILHRVFSDNEEEGVFYEAVENAFELEDVCDKPADDPKAIELKNKLSKIYMKRATIRNKKSSLIAKQKARKEQKAVTKEKDMRATALKRPERKLSAGVLPSDKIKEERKKTLQRLRAYKKKSQLPKSISPDNSDDEYLPASDVPPPKVIKHVEKSVPKPETKPSPKSVILKPHSNVGTSDVSLSVSQPAAVSSPQPPLPPPPPPPVGTPSAPPPPPPPPTSLPPPPPPPPPISSTTNTVTLSDQILANKLTAPKTKAPERQQSTLGGFDLDEILSIRNKLKKHTEEISRSRSGTRIKKEPDIASLLQSTLDNIRSVTMDTDSESDSENHGFLD